MDASSGMLAIYAPPSDFIPSRFNVPHRHPDAEMVESIRAHGNFQPVLARPIGISTMIEHGLENRIPPEEAGAKRFELVLGERRWRACDIVGRPVLVIVRSLSDEEAMTLQFEENLHRQDLTPMQEATAFAHFLAQLGGDLDAAARKVHKSPAYLAKRLKLLDLPKAGQDALQNGAILLGTAVEIACLSEADRPAALALVMPHAGEDAIPVREGRDRITARFHLRISAARFPVDDAALVPNAGLVRRARSAPATSSPFLPKE
jgi:ParB/RepB/Spo0J family partition protein